MPMQIEPAESPERQEIVVDTIHDLHADHQDPQHQVVEQNLLVALLPLALMAFVALGFVAAVWTILVAR